MPRVDIGDVLKAKEIQHIDCGYPRGIDRYEFGKELGRGGFGVVRLAVDRQTGKEYACKSIVKRLDVPNVSLSKQAAYLDNVKREVAVLRRLQGTLNVVHFVTAYEDDTHIHAIMEYCRGGELYNRIGRSHYSERVASSYMRGVLRTLSQCHSLRILHRDIKAGNFMLLNDDESAPLKAIDFGLAVFFDPSQLPRTDLGLEGTPWFMAPEVLSSKVVPASDVWSAGILAYQLLCGSLPFDDRGGSLPKIWKAILTAEPSFSGSAWQDISPEAKDFVRALLNKEEAQRPTAREALQHPWLRSGGDEDRGKGSPLSHSVIQRIQRFQQGNAVKRTIFEMIAQELLNMLPPPPPDLTALNTASHRRHDIIHENMLRDMPLSPRRVSSFDEVRAPKKPSPRGGSSLYSALKGTLLSQLRRRKESQALLRGPGGGAVEGPPLLDRLSGSAHGGLEYYRARGDSVHKGQSYLAHESKSESVHGGGNYWAIMRAAAAAARWNADQGRGGGDHLRHAAKMSQSEREGQRKVARLALDTSAHGGIEYQKLRSQLASGDFSHSYTHHHKSPHRSGSGHRPPSRSGSKHGGDAFGKRGSSIEVVVPMPEANMGRRSLEEKGRGQSEFLNFLEAKRSQAAERNGESIGSSAESSLRGCNASQPGVGSCHGEASNHTSISSHRAAAGSSPSPSSIALASSLYADNSSTGSSRANSVHGNGQLSSSQSMPVPSPRSSAPAAFALPSGPGINIPGAASRIRPDTRSTFDEESLPTIREGGPCSLTPSEGVLLGDSCRSEASLLNGDGSHHSNASVESNPMLRGLGGDRSDKFVPLVELRDILRQLNFTREGEAVTAEALEQGLQRLGYRLDPSEMRLLTNRMRQGEEAHVRKSAFLASQIDWAALLEDHRETWLEAVRRVFEGLEGHSGGTVTAEALVGTLRNKLPKAEVDYALEDALLEAGYANEEQLDFEGFLRLLQANQQEELDQYDARLPRSASKTNLLRSLSASEL